MESVKTDVDRGITRADSWSAVILFCFVWCGAFVLEGNLAALRSLRVLFVWLCVIHNRPCLVHCG